jgi:hypothetical protein
MGAMMCMQIINLQISIVAKKLKTKEKIKIQDEDLGFHPLARDKSYMVTSGPCKGTYFERVDVGFCRINQVHLVFHPLQEVLIWLPPLTVDPAHIPNTDSDFALPCMTIDDRWLDWMSTSLCYLSRMLRLNEIKVMRTHIHYCLLSLHHLLVTCLINI